MSGRENLEVQFCSMDDGTREVFCKGVIAWERFAEAASRESGVSIGPEAIRYGHARWIPFPRGDEHEGRVYLCRCASGRGAFPVTWAQLPEQVGPSVNQP